MGGSMGWSVSWKVVLDGFSASVLNSFLFSASWRRCLSAPRLMASMLQSFHTARLQSPIAALFQCFDALSEQLNKLSCFEAFYLKRCSSFDVSKPSMLDSFKALVLHGFNALLRSFAVLQRASTL